MNDHVELIDKYIASLPPCFRALVSQTIEQK
jgi:hypothetical protein